MGTIRGVTLLLSLLRSGLRRLFGLNVLAALSLLLGIGLGCLWVRSMRVIEAVAYTRSSGQCVSIETIRGGLMLILVTPLNNVTQPIGWSYADGEYVPRQVHFMEYFSSFGFMVEDNEPTGPPQQYVEAKIPLWFLIVLMLVLPLFWVRRWRRRREKARRVRLGRCLQCGYDTRATPDPNGPRLPQCPECGHPSQAAGDPSSVNGDQRT